MTSPANPVVRRTGSGQRSFGRALVWLGIALLALGAWLAWPRSSGARAPLDMVLVDVSKSVVGPRGPAWASFARDRIAAIARDAAERHADACVIAFGGEVRTLVAPTPAKDVLARVEADPRSPAGLEVLERGAPSGGPETNLAAAFELAATLALDRGATRLGLRLKLTHAQREALIQDASGDRLDAALCLMQAAWASTQPGFGLPAGIDPLEGWIVSA